MEHAKTGANYVIPTKRIKLQHENNATSYFKSMQNVGFEQTSKFIEILLCKNNFFIGKNRNGNHLCGH